MKKQMTSIDLSRNGFIDLKSLEPVGDSNQGQESGRKKRMTSSTMLPAIVEKSDAAARNGK